jgi:hypothetical protein
VTTSSGRGRRTTTVLIAVLVAPLSVLVFTIPVSRWANGRSPVEGRFAVTACKAYGDVDLCRGTFIPNDPYYRPLRGLEGTPLSGPADDHYLGPLSDSGPAGSSAAVAPRSCIHHSREAVQSGSACSGWGVWGSAVTPGQGSRKILAATRSAASLCIGGVTCV